jgi:hypothetical protein
LEQIGVAAEITGGLSAVTVTVLDSDAVHPLLLVTVTE